MRRTKETKTTNILTDIDKDAGEIEKVFNNMRLATIRILQHSNNEHVNGNISTSLYKNSFYFLNMNFAHLNMMSLVREVE